MVCKSAFLLLMFSNSSPLTFQNLFGTNFFFFCFLQFLLIMLTGQPTAFLQFWYNEKGADTDVVTSYLIVHNMLLNEGLFFHNDILQLLINRESFFTELWPFKRTKINLETCQSSLLPQKYFPRNTFRQSF